VVEEYCWAITHEAVRPCCDQSVSGVLGFGCLLESVVYTRIFDHIYTEFRPASDLPGGIRYVGC